jgi:serine/threonine protein kinase
VKYKKFDEDDQEEPPDPVPYIGPALDPVIFIADSKRDAAKRASNREPLLGFKHPAPEQFPQRIQKIDLASSDQAQPTGLDSEASISVSKLSFNVDKKCGVMLQSGGRCERDLMCPVHSEEHKNAVSGRSEPFQVLRMRAQAKREGSSLQKASEPTTRLTINKGDHLELKEEEKKDLPYVLEKNLGIGGSASVEMVRDINTNLIYARKIIRNVYTRNLNTVKLSFLNEVRVMRLLASHHHIIQVFATYIAQRELALILSPVADSGDLHDFLGKYEDAGIHSPGRGEKTLLLYRAFGCLVSGLAFMHGQRVRHKDIKPQNILVHQGSVLYTDFGISLDFSKQAQSTTIGNPQSYTKRYCAPEVADWGNRNSKSDIFSLGCVFIEIIAALQPSLIPDALLEGPYHEKLSEQELSSYFTEVLDNKFSDDFVLVLVGMLHPDPNVRPKAADLKDTLFTVRSGFNMFCDLCTNAKHGKFIFTSCFIRGLVADPPVQELKKDEKSVEERATSPAPTSVGES